MIFRVFLIIVFVFLIYQVETTQKIPTKDSSITWTCIDIQKTNLVDGVTWKTENCTMGDPSIDPPLLVVNSVALDLSISNVRAIPAVPYPSSTQLQPIPDMASQNPNFIAGINGGYFWRVDVDGIWVDDVCRRKTRKEANSEVSSENVNNGVGDGLVKIDGKIKSNNCDCEGYSRPAVLKLDSIHSWIDVLYRGQTVDDSVTSAIAAGPNLVSYNSSILESYIDIPSDDDNINIYEHAANTAVGIVLDPKTSQATYMLMITTDGSDECGPKDYTCGLNSKNLASLMKDKFGCNLAMSMDQGGSTTMWIKGANPDRNGVVSRSHTNEPVEQDGPRNVANGLFFEVLTSKK